MFENQLSFNKIVPNQEVVEVKSIQKLQLVLETSNTGYTSICSFNQYLIVGCGNSKLKIYEVKEDNTIHCIKTMIPHANPVTALLLINNIFITSETTQDPLLKIWNLTDFTLIQSMKAHRYGISQIIAKSQTLIATSGFDKMIKVWELGHEEKSTSLKCELPILAIQFLSENMLASGGDDCYLTIWQWKQKKKLKYILAHSSSIYFIRNRNDQLVTGGLDGFIRIWEVDQLKKRANIVIIMKEFQKNINDTELKFSCKHQDRMYVSDVNNNIFEIDHQNIVKRLNIQISYHQVISGMAFYNGRIVICTKSGSVNIWKIN